MFGSIKELLNSIKSFLSKDFFRNIVTLLTGNTLAQLVSFLAIPILTRLYTPEEFGVVALFISIINVCAIASTGRFDMAVVPTKRNGHAFHLMVGSIGISLVFSLLCLLVITLFRKPFAALFDDSSFGTIVWLLPLFVFLIGSHKSLHFWYNRKREYGTLAINRVAHTTSQTADKLSRSLFSSGYWGLVIGNLIGEVLAWVMLVRKLLKSDWWRFKYISLATIRKVFKANRNFPAYLLPMGVLNTFSVNILVFALSAITTSTLVGFYERAWRVLHLPLSLLSTSFGNVFYEKMSRASKPLRFYTLSYLSNLLLVSALMIPVILWGEIIFCFVLGDEWEIAGRIARILAPLTIFNFATACISNVFSVYHKNHILLIWQVAYLLIVLGWIFFASSLNIFLLIQVYAILGALLYALLAVKGFLIVLNISRQK